MHKIIKDYLELRLNYIRVAVLTVSILDNDCEVTFNSYQDGRFKLNTEHINMWEVMSFGYDRCMLIFDNRK